MNSTDHKVLRYAVFSNPLLQISLENTSSTDLVTVLIGKHKETCHNIVWHYLSGQLSETANRTI